MRRLRFVVALPLLFSTLFNAAKVFAQPAPDHVRSFVKTFCIECHGPKEQKGEFRLDTLSWEFTDRDSCEQWDLVAEYVSDGDMPPKNAKRHPGVAEKGPFLAALNKEFQLADKNARPGGTPLRRLNRVEYLNTLRDLFGYRMIHLPASFPADGAKAEFDTMPEGLFLSPPVMESYHEMASSIADRFAPLPYLQKYSSDLATSEIGVDEFRLWIDEENTYLRFTGVNTAGWSGAVWDSSFVAPASGVYRVKVKVRAQGNAGADRKPLRLGVYAIDPKFYQLPKRFSRSQAIRVAGLDVPATESRQWLTCEVPVEAGESLHIYCENRFKVGTFPEEGGLTRAEAGRFPKFARGDPAPTIEISGLALAGPIDVPPHVKAYFGEWPAAVTTDSINRFLMPLVERAYRRPLSDGEKERFIDAVMAHHQKAPSSAHTWHYAIRRLLCSPAFLYREPIPAGDNAELDPYTLASRLSYFLWSSMPDESLLEDARTGELTRPDILEKHVKRMLADQRSARFIEHFTGQWLGNRKVSAINVCDNRYTWDENIRYGYIRSTELFFEEILKKNLPVRTLLDSDFTYANDAMLALWSGDDHLLGRIASYARNTLVIPEPRRLNLDEARTFPNLKFAKPYDKVKTDSIEFTPTLALQLKHRGGILGLPGVLTITGDGVESSPILRGVWVLENIFGDPPPPPPKNVPALDVDISDAKTIRETLAAHTKLDSCASCHRDIDPLGLALENFDAIGGWRTTYHSPKPSRKKKQKKLPPPHPLPGVPIDATAEMPDGVILNGPESIKKHLLEHPEVFTRCLLIKLLEYGAGREMNKGDLRIVSKLVEAEPVDGYGLRDLVEAAVTSEVFRTK